MPKAPITLREAAEQDRLEDFIRQEEARGVGPADKRDFDKAVAAVIRAPQWQLYL